VTDYDKTDVRARYDRARDHGPENVDLWMGTVAGYLDGRSVSRILDIACGRGRDSEGLAARFDADVIGLHPSSKMLDVARHKRRGERVQSGDARE
jgi:ubiquinone/menaquinone biosynthesis C-methylase UbiE